MLTIELGVFFHHVCIVYIYDLCMRSHTCEIVYIYELGVFFHHVCIVWLGGSPWPWARASCRGRR